ncbi:alpha/beta fold hydrolase [uncultured Herbaspirillum sp.]|uniref:alpha/beta fold hydrolase n=1 Tax=uncultured Herbaspirillum sp. TaxID=160236 RepID=UPI00258FBA3C|nr:alpha/beta fold hydrolase [uncultured Herbaspirillum sp.]
MIPQAVIAVTALLTLKSDTSPVKVKVNKPRGTLYWGGAGLNGDYIADQLAALQEVGIKDVFSGTRTYTLPADALRSGTTLRYKNNVDSEDWTIHGMEKNQSSQFNMIGYSYGSLLAAHTALFYAENGHVVDHLVLVASPIDGDFLADLKKQPNVKNIIVKDIPEYGDPLFAGMSQVRLFASLVTLVRQMNQTQSSGEGVGHFYYASASSEGRRRRRELASFIHRQGLR